MRAAPAIRVAQSSGRAGRPRWGRRVGGAGIRRGRPGEERREPGAPPGPEPGVEGHQVPGREGPAGGRVPAPGVVHHRDNRAPQRPDDASSPARNRRRR